MIGTRRQIKLAHRCSHQTLTFVMQPAKFANFPNAHVSLVHDVRHSVVGEVLELNITRSLNTFTNRFRGFANPITRSVQEPQPNCFDVNRLLQSIIRIVPTQ